MECLCSVILHNFKAGVEYIFTISCHHVVLEFLTHMYLFGHFIMLSNLISLRVFLGVL